MFQIKFCRNQEKHFVSVNIFECQTFYDVMWKKMVVRQATDENIWDMRSENRITKARL